jgi:hypothetical protein
VLCAIKATPKELSELEHLRCPLERRILFPSEYRGIPTRSTMERAYAASREEVLGFFQVEEHQGLSAEQVQAAREKYGKNG